MRLFASGLNIVTGYDYSSLKRANAAYLLDRTARQCCALTNPFFGTSGTDAVFERPKQ